MLIKINGVESEVRDGLSVQELLQAKNLRSGVAVALNGKVVHAEKWADTKLRPDDEIDLIRHVGGG